MVLADDNFASVAAAVEEGRTVYDNLRKAIVFILPTNVGQGGMLVVAILFGLTLPITAAQILWVNMVTAVTLALAIAFERGEADLMSRLPRNPRAAILDAHLAWRIAFVGLLFVVGGMGMFLWELDRGASLEVARTAAINTLLAGEVFYLFNVRSRSGSVLNWSGFFGNLYVLGAIGMLIVCQALFTYLPVMQGVFGTASLGWAEWGRILAFGVCVLLLVELEKKMILLWGKGGG